MQCISRISFHSLVFLCQLIGSEVNKHFAIPHLAIHHLDATEFRLKKKAGTGRLALCTCFSYLNVSDRFYCVAFEAQQGPLKHIRQNFVHSDFTAIPESLRSHESGVELCRIYKFRWFGARIHRAAREQQDICKREFDFQRYSGQTHSGGMHYDLRLRLRASGMRMHRI